MGLQLIFILLNELSNLPLGFLLFFLHLLIIFPQLTLDLLLVKLCLLLGQVAHNRDVQSMWDIHSFCSLETVTATSRLFII